MRSFPDRCRSLHERKVVIVMSSSIKSARTLGLAGLMAVVAMLVIASVGAASASAAPEWGKCFKETGGLYKDGQCTEKTGGEFEWEAFTSAVTVKSEGTLTLEDSEAPGGASVIECSGTDEGTVGPGSTDELTKVTASSCKRISGSCEAGKAITAKADHLPWKTTLVAGPRDELGPGTGGEPGWTVECTVAGIFKVQDKCDGATSTGIANVSSGVDATFDATSRAKPAFCSLSNKNSGKVYGTDHILNPTGIQLSVK